MGFLGCSWRQLRMGQCYIPGTHTWTERLHGEMHCRVTKRSHWKLAPGQLMALRVKPVIGRLLIQIPCLGLKAALICCFGHTVLCIPCILKMFSFIWDVLLMMFTYIRCFLDDTNSCSLVRNPRQASRCGILFQHDRLQAATAAAVCSLTRFTRLLISADNIPL